jgi:NADH-quinone oxidoreductase subunit G
MATATPDKSKVSEATTRPAAAPPDTFTVKVDGKVVTIPRTMPDWSGKPAATTMMQACEAAGAIVPHYCYHPKLPVAGNCRMCLVEYGTPAIGADRKPVLGPDGAPLIRKSPRPAIACATPVTAGMEIYTNTPAVKAMREGVLEFLLINHPLDCPVCDQAGECKLQEYSVEYGQAASRFVEAKVHKPKAVDLGPRIMLDDERCILCTRCIRFTRDVVKDDKLGIINRGSYNTIAAYPGTLFDNNYTLNTVDICPVGALTSKDFRFQMRVWFLKETKSLCTSCATGCNVLIGSRENRVYRYVPRENAAVNGCWLCDAGRLNYRWIGRDDRLAQLRAPAAVPPTWTAVVSELAGRLKTAKPGTLAIIGSGRQTNEELWLLKKLGSRLGALTDAIPRTAEGDGFLVSADRNPNSLGAKLTGLAAAELGAGLGNIAEGIRRGTIQTLLVFGEDVVRHGLGAELLSKLQTLIVSDILPSKTTELAHFVLPGCAHAEKRGTFTNGRGRVQRFFKAVEPPGMARPEVDFLTELVEAVTGEKLPTNLPALFNRMAHEVAAFRGLSWAGLGDEGTTVPVPAGEGPMGGGSR